MNETALCIGSKGAACLLGLFVQNVSYYISASMGIFEQCEGLLASAVLKPLIASLLGNNAILQLLVCEEVGEHR